ncbi:uncharacterized protein LOC120675080 [Panicum virgatum]|uniref:DUF1618 domain-containing protein n=1 Tax=Panicum virgatum TaxID=38727 RepID=A0A8T0S8D7_PANVG|nr:uncharacterized protein LOC120675080 [Panicum virgatum]KAG2593378.1 hypothetical protein PVAP13_5NG170946 [Panicum virgatum]
MDVIVASFWSKRPPLLSRLYVYSPDLDPSAFSELPRILCVVEGLILFRVAIRCRQPGCVLMEECDYFVYHVDSASLELIPNPNPSPVAFRDEDVSLLPRGNGGFTVAALVPTTDPKVFMLHLLHSAIGSWTSQKVSLEAPQNEFPMETMEILRDRVVDACRLLHHSTSTVITLGGEKGTMGWVDLWRGILLCDVLLPEPELRGVPLPLPRAMFLAIVLPDEEIRIDFGCTKLYRGIAFIKEKRCLRFLDLDISNERLPDKNEKSLRFGWTVTTWSNCNLINSFDDWKMDCLPVHGDIIRFDEQMQKQLLKCQLLRPRSAQDKDNSVGRNLENLLVFLPTPSMDNSDVVFFIAKAEFLHPETYVFAIDMRSNHLQDVTEFGVEMELCDDFICHLGSVI